MAYSESKKIFSDVTLSVDVHTFTEPDRVHIILSAYSGLLTEVSPLCYEVKGSFKEIDELFLKLSRCQVCLSPTSSSPCQSPPRDQKPNNNSNTQHPQAPRDSPRHPQGPRDSPHHPQGPRDSPHHPQGPRDSPHHPQGPRDSPHHPQGPRDSPHHPQGPRDSPHHPQGPRDSPHHPQGPRDSPHHPQGPRDSPHHPQGPRDSPHHPQGPRDSPHHPQGPRDSPHHPQGPRDSPHHPQGPRDSPHHPQGPRDSPHHPQGPSSSTSSVKPVEVVRAIWDFIQQNFKKELERIRGGDIDIQPAEISTSKCPDKILVTFQSHGTDQVQAVFARERFITFYQRLATDMQVLRENLDPHDVTTLRRVFPDLLFACGPGKGQVFVTGRCASIVKLKNVLKDSITTRPSSAGTSQQPVNPRERSRPSGASSLHKMPSGQPEENCAICLETIDENYKTILKCNHSFCRGCLDQAFRIKPVCPTCGTVYGQLEGTQPKGGTMTVRMESSSLPGYENYGTIIIEYHIKSGTQTEEHPNPGQPYQGVTRSAYLPDSTNGRKVMKLLRRAFDQRLTFTIGRSSTTGVNNTVTWNDIHHKTSRYGGTSCYGYPDPAYLNRVQEELKVKGIY
ncbi:hypothetical protein DPEC_G00119460 [Dallia pectoralis]|uniref:Uncharacterized protein n=1 Tax=Dallia pectoralis TaxID=75939 RepID=A0ACC2GPF3_DALPE|nr:hypothetical protein DPEC_G00119460 [Dallia pectoralis]